MTFQNLMQIYRFKMEDLFQVNKDTKTGSWNESLGRYCNFVLSSI